ncbi:hybrid sensor histidine kinase/response regulator transcription factor [Neolewinella agarilytica]|uniref:histidine kinase n=1 Tax=Neolewinella agarilytica TaxID=478744 RepID=A0A1H9EM39_9BACT|nr:hybrid sensor histidine kinase/response regulator transcription factor [Neolewinella agarilytica]SEQ26657.1 Signal transduction histidine kinase [Neolewinella agarilytica]
MLFCSYLFAQVPQPYFDTYTTRDGLGAEAINDLLTDQYGYLWTAAYSGLHRYDGHEFLKYSADILDSCALSNNIVRCLAEDESGNLWVGTSSGLNRLDRASGCFQRFFHQQGHYRSLPANNILDLLPLADGDMLVVTSEGPARYHQDTDDFKRLSSPLPFPDRAVIHEGMPLLVGKGGVAEIGQSRAIAVFKEPEPPEVFALISYGDSLIIGTSRGLYAWQPHDSLIRYLYPELQQINRSILDIQPGAIHGFEGLYMAVRGEGLSFIDIASGEGVIYTREESQSNGLLDNHVRALAPNGDNGLWIGTYLGLNYLNARADRPRHYLNQLADGQEPQTLEIHVSPQGVVFTYERWRGLFRSSRVGTKAELLDFPRNDFLQAKDLNCFHTDRQNLTWIGRGHDALYRYDNESERFLTPFRHPDLVNCRINAIYQDEKEDHQYWLGTSCGLGLLDMLREEIEWFAPTQQFPELVGNALATIIPGPKGRIWCSAGDYYQDRLGYFSPSERKFHFYDYAAGNPDKSAGGRIKQLAIDPEGNVWAAASDGLIEIPSGKAPVLHTRLGAEQLGSLESVVADSSGIWFSSENRIGNYRPEQQRMKWFSGSPLRQFNNSVASKIPDGSFFFGGIGGLVRVDPNRLLSESSPFPSLVLQEVKVNGQERRTNVPWEELTELRLERNERALSLRFVALDFGREEVINYSYQINGGEWQVLGRERSLAFTDLQPGQYVLNLRVSNGRGQWSAEVRKISIFVTPYWYERKDIRLAGLFLAGLLALLLARAFVRRRLERQTIRQLREMDSFRNRLLTNLTHEFRTPLTLILGPARRLRERAKKQEDPTLAREARRIDRQGRKLLELINQLLDLRRITHQQLSIEYSPVDLSGFVSGLVNAHKPAAREKGISLAFEQDLGAYAGAVQVDTAKLDSILTNLIANAIKFTPNKGQIRVLLNSSSSHWTVRVQDSGPGVPVAERKKIFEQFIRAPEASASGTGIGLALVQELTTLMEGEISVGDAPLGGAEFQLSLPLRKTMSSKASPSEIAVPEGDLLSPAGKTNLPRLLIVEDDKEIRDFLKESLCDYFSILQAADGQKGLAIARQETPDLVISDVMMPGLNGHQLCSNLKADPLTSHLPVLLLTARTADEHRLEGLEHGADAYLTKPFQERELHLRLRNLLALRDRMATRLRTEWLPAGKAPPEGEQLSPAEAGWLTELRTYIHQHIDDPGLKGADLERHLGMSRSQLHRKLSSVLGLSPNRLINDLRLETASQLLLKKGKSVSEVAYACGFNDPGYFRRKFKERFGKAPSDWANHRAG